MGHKFKKEFMYKNSSEIFNVKLTKHGLAQLSCNQSMQTPSGSDDVRGGGGFKAPCLPVKMPAVDSLRATVLEQSACCRGSSQLSRGTEPPRARGSLG